MAWLELNRSGSSIRLQNATGKDPPLFMGVGKMDVPFFFGGRSTIHKLYTLSYTYLLHVLIFN